MYVCMYVCMYLSIYLSISDVLDSVIFYWRENSLLLYLGLWEGGGEGGVWIDTPHDAINNVKCLR